MNAAIVHKNFMMRCLQLAEKDIRKAAPNPSVGAVLVYKDKIIGEGNTQAFGGKHAEVVCIESVEAKNQQHISQSTLYVSLEPCMHFGKTPPCTNFIKKNKVPKVIIGIEDPNPKMAGKAIKQLKDAGIEVVNNILKEECEWSNRRYFYHNKTNLPYVVLKYAQTQNDFFALNDDRKQWISNQLSTRLSHKIRSQNQAILVGKRTAIIDNPKLNTRYDFGLSPIRVIIDKNLEIPKGYNIFNNSVKTIIFNKLKHEENDKIVFVKINFDNQSGSQVILQILEHLGRLNIQSLIVEGGATTLQHFIDGNYWNEAVIIKSETLWESGLVAPKVFGKKLEQYNLGKDEVLHLQNYKALIIKDQ